MSVWDRFYRLVGYPSSNPKHGEKRMNNELKNGYDNKFKQKMLSSSAYNVVVED